MQIRHKYILFSYTSNFPSKFNKLMKAASVLKIWVKTFNQYSNYQMLFSFRYFLLLQLTLLRRM